MKESALNQDDIVTYWNRMKEDIANADKVLVGIGNEFDIPGYEVGNWDSALELQRRLREDHFPEAMDKAYLNLKQLLEGKDYYIISMCMDDGIFRIFSKEDSVVCPCGNLQMVQCEDGCDGLLLPYQGIEKRPICPVCKKEAVFNNVYANNYVEGGYLEKFTEYRKWLQTTINKKLCILELGVGMRFPSVIRFAFDKMAFYNQKCSFYRIHESLYQHTAENAKQGISIAMNSKEFLESSVQ